MIKVLIVQKTKKGKLILYNIPNYAKILNEFVIYILYIFAL